MHGVVEHCLYRVKHCVGWGGTLCGTGWNTVLDGTAHGVGWDGWNMCRVEWNMCRMGWYMSRVGWNMSGVRWNMWDEMVHV